MFPADPGLLIINSISKNIIQFNRRSHDKLLVVDGNFPSKAVILTGGRNISLDYYGLKEDGTKDPDAFKDMEILLRHPRSENTNVRTVGDSAAGYYTGLSLYSDNKKLNPLFAYKSQQTDAQKALAKTEIISRFSVLL